MTSPATPIPAAAKQQHDQNDYQDQVHGNSPLIMFDGDGFIRPRAGSFNATANFRFPIALSGLPKVFGFLQPQIFRRHCRRCLGRNQGSDFVFPASMRMVRL
jgi:hypothetical protein